MKLGTKLGISNGAVILAMVISASVANLSLAAVARIAHEIDDQRRPFLLTTQILQRDLANSVIVLQSSLISGTRSTRDPTGRNGLIAAQDTINSDLLTMKALDGTLDLGPDEGRMPGIIQQFEEIQRRELESEEQSDLGTPEGAIMARTSLEQRVLPLSQAAYHALGNIIANQSTLIAEQLDSLHLANIAARTTLWIATILGAFVGGFLSLCLGRRITHRIGLVAERAEAIASGDLTNPELDIDSIDQIGSLAHAMQQMQDSLRNIIRTVANTANSLTASAVSMSSATDHIHRRVDQQTQQTQQAATAMQEMSASVAEVSRHTQSAAETARSAAQTAHEGGAIVQQMLGAMQSIATAVSDTSSTIGLLGEDSRRISQIVTVIDEIATKTNLLALNAAIEAARAGDHGRGFAVVAGEVRHLAESTAQATGEISAMIQGIQDRARTAIASMAQGTVTVQQGVATTNQAGEALERIIGIAERVDRMIAQIAIAASQQAASADQSTSMLDSIHTLSQANLYEVATTTTGIENLRATAATLECQVERFRLDVPDARPKAPAGRTSPNAHAFPNPGGPLTVPNTTSDRSDRQLSARSISS
jgi:methyl-accepting chemotaxis protein